MARPSWDEYFLQAAHLLARRATCSRKHVGAVLVTADRRIVAEGYNGAPRGMPSCDEVDHEISDGHCIRTLHAEDNALVFAGRDAQGCTLYVTASPCYDCAKRIVNAGIKRVCFDEYYASRYGKSSHVVDFLASAGIECSSFDSVGLGLFKRLIAQMDETEAEVQRTVVPR